MTLPCPTPMWRFQARIYECFLTQKTSSKSKPCMRDHWMVEKEKKVIRTDAHLEKPFKEIVIRCGQIKESQIILWGSAQHRGRVFHFQPTCRRFKLRHDNASEFSIDEWLKKGLFFKLWQIFALKKFETDFLWLNGNVNCVQFQRHGFEPRHGLL